MVDPVIEIPFRRVITKLSVDDFRRTFVQDWIATLTPGSKVIDVGAGLMPFQNTFFHLA